jgi:hypothetical protein
MKPVNPDTTTVTIYKTTHEIIKNLARLDDRSVKSWLRINIPELLKLEPQKHIESTQKPTEKIVEPEVYDEVYDDPEIDEPEDED